MQDQKVGHNNLVLKEENSEKNFSNAVILSPVLTKEWEMAKIWRIGSRTQHEREQYAEGKPVGYTKKFNMMEYKSTRWIVKSYEGREERKSQKTEILMQQIKKLDVSSKQQFVL